jgi:hypothetical protein
MGMSAVCANCGTVSEIGTGFGMRGKSNGYVVLMCNSCKCGLRVKNAGFAMLTKKAKTEMINAELWQRMTAEWDRNFPGGVN